MDFLDVEYIMGGCIFFFFLVVYYWLYCYLLFISRKNKVLWFIFWSDYDIIVVE